MEEFLTSILKCLPEVDRCCFCIKNLKLASIPCAILIFFVVLPQNRIVVQIYAIDYHHKPVPDPLAIIQAILAYSGTIVCIVAFITNILVFFMFCKNTIAKSWGYVFVLSFLTLMILDSTWCILAFIRSFFDPGLFCEEIEVIEEVLTRSKKKIYCKDVFVLIYLVIYIPLFYPMIVIYSWLRSPPYEPDVEDGLASSRSSSIGSGYSTRANSRAVSNASISVSRRISKRSSRSDPNERSQRKSIVINQMPPKDKENQETVIVSENEISCKNCKHTKGNKFNDKTNEDISVAYKEIENSGLRETRL